MIIETQCETTIKMKNFSIIGRQVIPKTPSTSFFMKGAGIPNDLPNTLQQPKEALMLNMTDRGKSAVGG